jgi:hypothetical protein
MKQNASHFTDGIAMNISRMNHLASILGRVKTDEFSLALWKCETTACAIGHAAQDPVFNDQGFYLKMAGSYAPAFLARDVELAGWNGIRGDVEHLGWGAVCAFFEITEVQMRHLFAFSHYPENASAQDVIARINELIASEMCGVPA